MKTKTYHFTIEEIPITVVQKRMKNMYLRIKKEDGTVLISAPNEMSEEHIYRFAKERIDWIRSYRQKYMQAKEGRAQTEQLRPEELQRQKAQLKQEVECLIAKWEPVMGVSVSGITIRSMKTRWGSCNVDTHRISINLSLAKKPPECLEYVVVHEMTHILEPSHSARFWDYMTEFYPNWKQVRDYLRDEMPE